MMCPSLKKRLLIFNKLRSNGWKNQKTIKGQAEDKVEIKTGPMYKAVTKATVMGRVKVVKNDHLEIKVNKAVMVERAKVVQKELLEIKVLKARMVGKVKAIKRTKKAHKEDQDNTNDDVFGQSILVLREGANGWLHPPTTTFII